MNNITTENVPECSCDCSTGQTRSSVACPICNQYGATVGEITPRHTLTKQARASFDPSLAHHFCENPDCGVVYYNGENKMVFRTDDLINRVTIKDESPETLLCYCFKVLKKHALEQLARTGATDVFQTIQSKMKPGQGCFCEKANPRGDTCVKDAKAWLGQQGIAVHDPVATEEYRGSCCS